MKKFKVLTTLVLECKKVDDHKTWHKNFHSIAKLVFNDSEDIDKALRSMHQRVGTRIKNFLVKFILLKQLWNIVIRSMSASTDGNKSIKNGDEIFTF